MTKELPHMVLVKGVTKKTPASVQVGLSYPVVRKGKSRFGPYVVVLAGDNLEEEVFLPENKVEALNYKRGELPVVDDLLDMADEAIKRRWVRTNASLGKDTEKAVLLDFGGITRWAPKQHVEVRDGIVYVAKWYADKAGISEHKADPIDAEKLLRAVKSGEVKKQELIDVMKKILGEE